MGVRAARTLALEKLTCPAKADGPPERTVREIWLRLLYGPLILQKQYSMTSPLAAK